MVYRGLLHTGDHVVYLWKSKLPRDDRKVNVVKTPMIEMKEGSDFNEKFNSILSGPAANNSSSAAARVVINFGNPDKPVHFPSTVEKSRQSLFKYIKTSACISIVKFDCCSYRQHPSIRNVEIRRHFEKFHRIFFMDKPTEKKLYHVTIIKHSTHHTQFLITIINHRLSLDTCF